MASDATLRPPLDPQQGFAVEGVRYRLDADPDTPYLWRETEPEVWIKVDVFGPSWDPMAVWLSAVQDRAFLKTWARAPGAPGGS